MEEIFYWVKNIVVYFILMAVVMQLVPGKQYARYIRLFMGIILVLIVLSPVGSLFQIDSLLSRIIDSFQYQMDIKDLRTEMELGEESNIDLVLGAYEQTISQAVRSTVEMENYKLLEVTAEVEKDSGAENFGEIKRMTVRIGGNQTGSSAISDSQIEVNKIEVGNKPVEAAAEAVENEKMEVLKDKLAAQFRIEKEQIEVRINK